MWLIAAVLVFVPRGAGALETDQFTVPPQPLADIGPELSVEVMARIDAAVGRVNARAVSRARAVSAAGGFWRRHHQRELDKQLSEAALAREVYRELAGAGLPECHIERWVRKHRFEHRPARFEMSCGRGAYGASPLGRSLFLMSLSPTVNTFGVYCGVDKVGHLFQQGYQYFEQFTKEETRRGPGGGTHAAALAAAVRRGVAQERGFFGLMLVGVYSNADLAANYAGLHLYLNLTRTVRIGALSRPALLVLRDGQWVHNPHAALPSGGRSLAGATATDAAALAEAFFRPFVSDHFNEALNPSLYTNPTRDTVRAGWRNRAGTWAAFYRSTRQTERIRLVRMTAWHGAPYGHSGIEGLVVAPDTCFPDERVALPRLASGRPPGPR